MIDQTDTSHRTDTEEIDDMATHLVAIVDPDPVVDFE